MNWSVNFDKDIMRDKPLKRLLKASPWVKKIKRGPHPGSYPWTPEEVERAKSEAAELAIKLGIKQP